MIRDLINDLGGGPSAALAVIFASGCWLAVGHYINQAEENRAQDQSRFKAIEAKIGELEVVQAQDNIERREFKVHARSKWHAGAGEAIPALQAEINNLKHRVN